MIRALLTAMAVTIPVAALATPISGVLPWNDTRPAPRGKALLIDAMMQGHNLARSRYGVAPLVWDEALAKDAQRYASILARFGRFEHDPQVGRYPKQGENLFMGTRTAYRYQEMVKGWVDERRQFRGGRFPYVSKTGDWSAVGHYTQIIWPTTKRVGCASASNQSDDYLVCRYWPAGNVVGTVLR
ncbi:CAP family protein [Sphingomonas jaspsi]|uniref:CAP family protein n=1 Tax=Sphingomonas jaspsi TaxID=392409 RepID=UPI001FE163C9|nr:CAP family protein [Sphingomonas jaspsi]